MEGIYYDCNDDRFGNVTLYDDKGNDIYLQGDDAAMFQAEWDNIVKIWTRKYGKGHRKHYGAFNSYSEMMDYVISQYF